MRRTDLRASTANVEFPMTRRAALGLSAGLVGAAMVGMSSPMIARARTSTAANIVGKVTRLQGAASVALDGAITELGVGSGIPLGGTLETGPDARLIIVFEDASQLTLGADARLVVDEMVYDFKAQEEGRVVQRLTSLAGTFLFSSGAVGRDKPDAVTFRTPVATIGIRGTEFFGGSLAAGMPPGQTHYGFMLLEGAISVDAPEGSVVLDEFQEGTFLPDAGRAPPTDPRQWSREAIDEALASVSFS